MDPRAVTAALNYRAGYGSVPRRNLARGCISSGGSNPTQELQKLYRYFNCISVRIPVLSGAPFPPMVKVASGQSHFAPSGRGAKWVRWVSRSVGRGKTMVEDR